MCGRYSNTRTDDELRDAFGVQAIEGPELEANWNVAPTDDVRFVRDRTDRGAEDGSFSRELRTAHWGLVPFWSKSADSGYKMINARFETLLDKPAYKAAARRRRCILPADGYFEWTTVAGQRRKQPYFLHAEQDGPLAFAGLYELWKNPDVADGDPRRWLVSTTVITHQATDAIGHVHDRMPLIIPTDMLTDWLDPDTEEPSEVRQLLDAIPEPTLVPRKVSTEVNNVRNNGPELVEAVA